MLFLFCCFFSHNTLTEEEESSHPSEHLCKTSSSRFRSVKSFDSKHLKQFCSQNKNKIVHLLRHSSVTQLYYVWACSNMEMTDCVAAGFLISSSKGVSRQGFQENEARRCSPPCLAGSCFSLDLEM